MRQGSKRPPHPVDQLTPGTEDLLHDGLSITRRSLGMTTNRRQNHNAAVEGEAHQAK